MTSPAVEIASGPRAMDRAARRRVVDSLVQSLRDHFEQRLGVVAVYGSVARGTDGPYSDIEMLAVLRGDGGHEIHEWIFGPGKAKVHVYAEDAWLSPTRVGLAEWSFELGKLRQMLPLWGDPAPLHEVRRRLESIPATQRATAGRAILIADAYESLGKLRNGVAHERCVGIAPLILHFVESLALSLGLADGAVYTSRHLLLDESMALNGAPAAYVALCERVREGDLGHAASLVALAEQAFAEACAFVEARGADLGRAFDVPVFHAQPAGV